MEDAISAVYAELECPDYIIGSANGTWVDDTEAAAARKVRPDARVATLYGIFPEMFSVGPLAGVASILLNGTTARAAVAGGGPGNSTGDSFGVLCSGYSGTVAGVTVLKM